MLIRSSFSAAAAGPLTIKGDQCECAEAKKAQSPVMTVSDKRGLRLAPKAERGRDRGGLSEHGQTSKWDAAVNYKSPLVDCVCIDSVGEEDLYPGAAHLALNPPRPANYSAAT